MGKRTQQHRLVAALQARGETTVPGRTHKYMVLTRAGDPNTFFFVSRAVSDRFKASLLAEADEARS